MCSTLLRLNFACNFSTFVSEYSQTCCTQCCSGHVDGRNTHGDGKEGDPSLAQGHPAVIGGHPTFVVFPPTHARLKTANSSPVVPCNGGRSGVPGDRTRGPPLPPHWFAPIRPSHWFALAPAKRLFGLSCTVVGESGLAYVSTQTLVPLQWKGTRNSASFGFM